jgi:hypothetical protein
MAASANRWSACGRALRPWLGRTLLPAAVRDQSGRASLAGALAGHLADPGDSAGLLHRGTPSPNSKRPHWSRSSGRLEIARKRLPESAGAGNRMLRLTPKSSRLRRNCILGGCRSAKYRRNSPCEVISPPAVSHTLRALFKRWWGNRRAIVPKRLVSTEQFSGVNEQVRDGSMRLTNVRPTACGR